MRILLVTDQHGSSDHSAIEAIFGRHLPRIAEVVRVYFDRDIAKPERTSGGKIVLPHRCRRRDLTGTLDRVVGLSGFDVVVVRNLFPVLRQVLAERTRHHYQVAFWDSFPHAYRRRVEATLTGRARLRKTLEYRWRHFAERRLLGACDAYLPITETHHAIFFPELKIPVHPLPMGFDFENYIEAETRPERRGPIRFIYAGTIDRLRRMDTVLAGFGQASAHFELHVYTPTPDTACQALGLPPDSRFVFHKPVPRDALITHIAAADVGVSLIPPEKLYLGSSPTKTLEYYAAGVPALLSELPDHQALFDENIAFFAPFSADGIADAVERAARSSRAELDAMGLRGQDHIRQSRDYARMAADLLSFLADPGPR